MAIARLSRVTLLSSRKDVGVLLAMLCKFGSFHPSKRDYLVQDIELLLLASKAQSISYEARELLEAGLVKTQVEAVHDTTEFDATDMRDLIRTLDGLVADAKERLAAANDREKEDVRNRLLAMREAANDAFRNLERIRVHPGLRRFLLLEGYVPTDSMAEFERLVGDFLVSASPVDRREPEDPYVPSMLVNPRVISVFERLTLEQGVPKYDEIDPTPIVAFVFPFFFGIMFSDVGHGILLLALGSALARRPRYAYWGRLLSVFAVPAIIIGFVRGAFFGLPFTTPLHALIPLPQALKEGFTLDYVPLLLEASVIIGTFHLATAYAIALINQLRHARYWAAFFVQLPTLLLYAGLVPLGLAVAGNGIQLAGLFQSNANTPVVEQFLGLNVPVSTTAVVGGSVALASLCILVAGHPLKEYRSTRDLRKGGRALAEGLLEATAKPFEFLMNTLSYARLGILLIVGTLLGSLVAGVAQLGAAGVAAAVVLNLAVMGIEGLIVYVQDMRLHVYEWFSKFYFGEGTPFAPLVFAGQLYHWGNGLH